MVGIGIFNLNIYMEGGTKGIFKGSPGNRRETIELQVQLWGDSDFKGYAEKGGPRNVLGKSNVSEDIQGGDSRMFSWNNSNIQHPGIFFY